jgi:hypothetical protein
MGMGEIHEGIGHTINYYGGFLVALGDIFKFFLDCPSNHIKTPFCSFLCDKLNYEHR